MEESKTEKKGTLDVKVCAYSIYVPPSKTVHIMAQFATTSDLDFFKTTNVPPELINNYKALVARVEENVRKITGKDVTVGPIFKRLIPVDSEAQLLERQEPVIYVGTFNEPVSAFQAVDMATSDYHMKVTFFHFSRDKKPEEFSPTELRSYLSTQFIWPLVIARAGGNSKAIHGIRTEVLAFAHGTPFLNEMARFCNTIEKGQYNTEIVSAYLDKIAAVHAQNYEMAAKMRDKIKALTTPLDTSAQRI